MRTYGSVSLSSDQTQWIIGRAEPHVSIRLKQLFPSIPKAAVPPYRLPHNLVTDTDLDWFMQRYPLEISRLLADLHRLFTPIRLTAGCRREMTWKDST
jgi:hypothetical protein